jgi:hypothetical protein
MDANERAYHLKMLQALIESHGIVIAIGQAAAKAMDPDLRDEYLNRLKNMGEILSEAVATFKTWDESG